MCIAPHEEAAPLARLSRSKVNRRRLQPLRIVDQAQVRKLPAQLQNDVARAIPAAAIRHHHLDRRQARVPRHQRAHARLDMLGLVERRDHDDHLLAGHLAGDRIDRIEGISSAHEFQRISSHPAHAGD